MTVEKVTPCCGVFAIPWYPRFGQEEPTLRCYNCDAVVSDDEMVDEDEWGECERCGRWTRNLEYSPDGNEMWCAGCAERGNSGEADQTNATEFQRSA